MTDGFLAAGMRGATASPQMSPCEPALMLPSQLSHKESKLQALDGHTVASVGRPEKESRMLAPREENSCENEERSVRPCSLSRT